MILAKKSNEVLLVIPHNTLLDVRHEAAKFSIDS